MPVSQTRGPAFDPWYREKKKTISKRMDIINQAVYTAIKHDLEAMPKREMPCNRMTELFIII